MENIINGKIVEICQPEEGETANGKWKRQNIIIETFAQYPRKVSITISNDKVDISQYTVGSVVAAYLNVESREYNGRWFTDFRLWRLEPGTQTAPQNQIQGTVTTVLDEVSGTGASGKSWKRQMFVIETQETYPRKVAFDVWGDRISKAMLQIGKQVTASVDMESRQGKNGGWFSSIQAYRVVEGIVQAQPAANAANFGVPTPDANNPTPNNDNFGTPTIGNSGVGKIEDPSQSAQGDEDELPF